MPGKAQLTHWINYLLQWPYFSRNVSKKGKKNCDTFVTKRKGGQQFCSHTPKVQHKEWFSFQLLKRETCRLNDLQQEWRQTLSGVQQKWGRSCYQKWHGTPEKQQCNLINSIF